MSDRPPPVRRAPPCSAARSTCRAGAVPPRARPPRPPVDGRGRDRRHRRRRRRRQDGPAAGGPVRHPRLDRHRGRRQPGRGRRDQRRPLPRGRGARARPSWWRRVHARGPPAGHARRSRGGPRGGRRRAHRAGHAGRGAPAGLPLHGPGGRVDRARASTPAAPSSSRRRCPIGDTRQRFAPGPRGGVAAWSPSATSSSPSRPSGSSRGAVLAEPGRLPEARRRDRRRVHGPGRALLRVACSTPRSWRCPRRRRPSSASSPTRHTATSTSPSPTSSRGPPTCTGIDVQEVIAAANSQPYSHIHQPGIGVGGHCIPVYPHLLLARAPGPRGSSRRRAGSTTARWTGRVAALDGAARRPGRGAGAGARPHLPRGRQGARLQPWRSR